MERKMVVYRCTKIGDAIRRADEKYFKPCLPKMWWDQSY